MSEYHIYNLEMETMGFHGAFFLFFIILGAASSLLCVNSSRPSKTSRFVHGSSTMETGSGIAACGDLQSVGEANTDESTPWNSLGPYNAGILDEQVDTNSLNRQSFPRDFLFGSSSSAFQFEGASKEGGKSPSIWDIYLQKHPDRVKDGSTGAIGVDSYHRYKEDVAMMKEIGFNTYRFSISWPRILPRGHLRGGVNREGIAYYNNLINELLSKGIQPFVTIFHWDLPQTLEDEYGGFLSPRIVKDFTDFAEVCYKEFGDRVKNWITVNEPYNFAVFGYGIGNFPPGRCSEWVSQNCSGGDSGVEPYTVAHHLLLAHASAAKLYRDKYQTTQNGRVGIALIAGWTMPLSQSSEDKEAAQRAIAFESGWFLEPLYFGSYPAEMVAYVGERLPKFSTSESAMLKGSLDFIGINYYTSRYAANTSCKTDKHSVLTDSCVSLTAERNGVPLGPKAASSWLYIYPTGIYDLLLHIKLKYQNPVIYVTENGVDEINDGTTSLEDTTRIDFYRRHLSHVRNAIQDGVQVKGYFIWSLLDNMEWMDGYTLRYGIVYVDYENQLKRYPKRSSKWFHRLLNQNYCSTHVQVQ